MRRFAVLALVILGCSPRSMGQEMLWHREVPFWSSVAADETLGRIIIGEWGTGEIEAIDQSGHHVWSERTDTCFAVSADGGRVWISHGRKGIVLDGSSGEALRKSRALRGVHQLRHMGEHDPAPGYECGRDGSFSPDGGRFFSARWDYSDEHETALESYRVMAVDTRTGKKIWRNRKHAYVYGLQPRTGLFFVNLDGIFGEDGVVLWVNRDAAHAALDEDLSETYPDRVLPDIGWKAIFHAVSADGQFILGTEMALPGGSGTADRQGVPATKRLVLYSNPGKPGEVWKKTFLVFAGSILGGAEFSDDGKFVVAKDDPGRTHTIQARPPTRIALFDTNGDGKPIWSIDIDERTIARALGLESRRCHGRRIRFAEDKILVDFGFFADLYSLDGKLLKRIAVPAREGETDTGAGFCDYWFLGQDRYAFLEKRMILKGWKANLELWVGSIDGVR